MTTSTQDFDIINNARSRYWYNFSLCPSRFVFRTAYVYLENWTERDDKPQTNFFFIQSSARCPLFFRRLGIRATVLLFLVVCDLHPPRRTTNALFYDPPPLNSCPLPPFPGQSAFIRPLERAVSNERGRCAGSSPTPRLRTARSREWLKELFLVCVRVCVDVCAMWLCSVSAACLCVCVIHWLCVSDKACTNPMHNSNPVYSGVCLCVCMIGCAILKQLLSFGAVIQVV